MYKGDKRKMFPCPDNNEKANTSLRIARVFCFMSSLLSIFKFHPHILCTYKSSIFDPETAPIVEPSGTCHGESAVAASSSFLCIISFGLFLQCSSNLHLWRLHLRCRQQSFSQELYCPSGFPSLWFQFLPPSHWEVH